MYVDPKWEYRWTMKVSIAYYNIFKTKDFVASFLHRVVSIFTIRFSSALPLCVSTNWQNLTEVIHSVRCVLLRVDEMEDLEVNKMAPNLRTKMQLDTAV